MEPTRTALRRVTSGWRARRPRATPADAPSAARERYDLLTRLYAEQLAAGGTEYLADHARPEAVRHHVNVFEWYAEWLRPDMTVLDWGCNHGPDSCLLRHRFGEAAKLRACDFGPADAFRVFRDYARAPFSGLSEPFHIPFADGVFDAVVGSGVLEHTAMDGEALKEVYRVLTSHGRLVLTFLPHAYSWAEWRQRNVQKRDFHRRLYSRRGLAALLLSHGFEPLEIRFQSTLPDAVAGPLPERPWLVRLLRRPFRPLRWPSRFVRHLPPAQAVLCCVARKMIVM